MPPQEPTPSDTPPPHIPGLALPLALVIAMALAGLLAWQHLPADARVPIHFNLQGQVDGWSTPWPGVFLLPLTAAFVLGVMGLVTRLDPNRQKIADSAPAIALIRTAMTVVMALLQWQVLAGALGRGAPSVPPAPLLLGALFLVVGNVMGKLRHNHSVGIRTPWTLADERVWDRTHRVGGRVMVAGGLLLCALPALGLPDAWQTGAFLALILGVAGWPVAYAWRLSRLAPRH